MGRRLDRLTLDSLAELPERCRHCVFWELDPVRRAQAVGQEEDGPATDGQRRRITEEGMVVGTARYMSPEQACAEPVDHRSDLFALGILLFEMATGAYPFRGRNSVEVVSSILRDDPPLRIHQHALRFKRPDIDAEIVPHPM